MGITARFGLDVALTIVLGGMSNAALDYLLVERLLRPVFAATFAFDDSTGSCRLRGVASRMVLTWAFTTGIPVLGVAAALFARGQRQLSAMVDPLYFLIAVALGCGMLGTWFVTRSLADPLGSLRRAMGQVAEGDTNVSVRVDDASEVGALQAGFNRMVAGLRERQLLQDLLGRQVGSEVARRAVERGIELGGESLDVAVFFVDVRNSTEITLRHSPAKVVAMLNRFFALVVDCVDRHGGWVNKFEGDAALCVFGAPLPNPDAAGAALGCARELQAALTEWGALQAAVGVAAGPVIAGNIGTESRFEYTVVGDPVNEAARLTDLAKSHPGRVLASLPTIELAADGERARWIAAGTALLRGRSSPTSLAVPTA
jgi:adenylate cyclase